MDTPATERRHGPRIRSLKPEIWRSPDFTKLSNVGRLVFVALITQADDAGRLRSFDATHLASIYCAFGTTAEEVEGQLARMSRLGMIVRYRDKDGSYVSLVNWGGHQHIDKPNVSRIPAPPDLEANHRGTIGERSGTRRSRARVKDQIGGEGIRSDPPIGSPTTEGGALVLVAPISVDPVDQIFNAWKLRWHPTARMTPERRAKILTRLAEGWVVEDLILAVTVGAENDPWVERHVGLNDDIKNLLRNGSSTEKFVNLGREAPSYIPSGKPSLSQRYRAQADRLEAQS